MSWILLFIAGILEVAFTFCMGKVQESQGTGKFLWLLGFLICMASSLGLMFKVTEKLPIGTAYAVWTGIGAAGTVLVGILFFNEPANFGRLFFIFLLIVSVIGLKVVSH